MSAQEKMTTTNFVVPDTEVVSAVPPAPSTISSLYFAASTDKVSESIAKFLGKPKKLASGSFTGSDVSTSFPTYLLPTDMLRDPIYYEKVKGYLGIRATVVLTLQVNAERFQQGRYMLSAIPCGGAGASTKLTENTNLLSASLVQRTQIPHVEIDINTEKACVLRLPYAAYNDYYPLQLIDYANAQPVWYSVRIFPYKSLEAVVGSIDAKYTLWVHLEDVELIGQTIPSSLTQANFTKSKVKKSNTEKEADSAGVGPISGAAAKVSQAANILSVIPYIGMYASTVSWAADIVGSVASVFGFSSPINMSAVTRTSRNGFAYATSLDKVDQSIPLAASIKNEVVVFPGTSSTDEDEMAIAHFVSRPTWQATMPWLTSAIHDQLIARLEVGLFPLGSAHTIPLPILQQCYTPAQYLSTRFSKWRGTVCFKIKFVKTEFHTGRFAICFNPCALNYSYNSPAILAANQPYVHRDIIDISDITEYSFSVPFISEVPYLPTFVNDVNMYGHVELRVVDPLVSPDTVSPEVTLLIETWLADDAEFCVPRTIPHAFVDPVPVQLQGAIGDMSMHTPSLETAKTCIGERILSLRALGKRFYPVRRININQAVAARGVDCFIPFASSVYTWATVQSYDVYSDLFTDLSRMFLFSRGGVRLKCTRLNSVTTPMTVVAIPSGADVYTPFITGPPAAISVPSLSNSFYATDAGSYMITEAENNQQIEVAIPQYHYSHSRIGNQHSASEIYPYFVDTDITSRLETADTVVYAMQTLDTTILDPDAVNDLKICWYRALADDANFSFFICIPPMTTSL